MTGLDKIVAQIEYDTDISCEEIKKRNDKRCEEIITKAEKRAKIIKEEAQIDALKLKNEIVKRAESEAKLKHKAVILGAKQEIIENTILAAMKYICSLSDEDYFLMIYKIIEKYCENRCGEIVFSEKDLRRLPCNFKDSLNLFSKGHLMVSESTIDINGGFVLRFGNVEENCSLESLFNANKERLFDEISGLLF